MLGIGGSGLGAVALRDALLGPFWNERDDEERDHFPRLHVVDNPDPVTFRRLLERLDPARTLFNVVSKSGSTAETMAQYLVARAWVEEAVGAGPGPGSLPLHHRPGEGRPPPDRRGRGDPRRSRCPRTWGAASPCCRPWGSLPARGLRRGRGRAPGRGGATWRRAAARPSWRRTRPAMLATLLHAADTEQGRPIHVLMPYADRLRSFALWFQQLWAESLGKARDAGRGRGPRGPTPAGVGGRHGPALAAPALHGGARRTRWCSSWRWRDRGDDVTIPARHPEIPSLSYLGGHTLGELLDAERRATAEALRRRGAAQRDAPAAAGGRPRAGPALHAPGDRHGVRRRPLRRGPAGPARGGAG